MTHHPPHQLQAHHLNRLAVICHEGVHPQQDAAQPGSPAGLSYDRNLVIRWGWPEKAILAIDQARSASSSGADRSDGFTRLCELVAQKQVGIIMMSITSSLPPSSSDLLRLFELCRDTNTLVAIDGAVVELDRWTDHLRTAIDATIFAAVNRRRAAAVITRAKRHYATEGRAVSNPPTGYIVTGKGQWGKDIPAVQERIKDVFRLYDSLGSVGKVVRFLAAQGLEMPLRTPAGQLHWVRPTFGRIYSILTNPAFAGRYVYGRHATVQGTPSRKQRTTTSKEQIIIPDHHEAYVSSEEWHRINSRLKNNASHVRRRADHGAAA